DFSKIQARFKNRMKLTSQDVEEVIRQRLLRKKDEHVSLLETLYAQQQNNFKTLFAFPDGAPSNRTYRDRDHFIHTYPFVPYQFVLFQNAIENLSLHNAFEGKHSSVGERSMLEVFQEVAIAIGGTEVGHLATFDRMFDGIRSTLKTQVQRSILNAENQLDDHFAIRLLKALFLVKYIKEFKATARNLTVLMYERFESDLPALREQVATALNLLEQATYVQRNGEIYQYLTDEEKDIEEEIKATEIDNDAVADELANLIFDGVLRGRRVRYEENGQDYTVGRKLDDRIFGREQELTIHVATPFHEHFGNEAILISQSMGRDELLVILPPNPRLRTDLVMYKKTEKYIRQTVSVAQQESTRRILAAKQTQNRERQTALETLVDELLGEAQLIVEGEELPINHGDAQNRIQRAFHYLIERTYPNLRMLRGTNFSESDISTLLQEGATLFGNEDVAVSEAERDMRGFIQANKRHSLRTSMTVLVNHFTRKPYGWHQAAVQCLLAKLIARNWVEVRQDGTLLDTPDRLAHALRNSRDFANLLFDPQIEFTATQTRGLRDFYADFFDGPPAATEAKALAQETAYALVALHEELTRHRTRAGDYPFLTALDGPLVLLASVIDRPYDFYLTELRRHEADLFQAKEDLIAPLRQLMAPNSAQRAIYDDAREFLDRQKPNLSYIEGTAATELQALLADPACFRGNKLQSMKRLLDTLRDEVQTAVSAERSRQQAAVQQRRERLTSMDDFQALSADQQGQLQAPFTDLHDNLARQDLIAMIRDSVRSFNERDYPVLLRQMSVWAMPP
ncbi:MAG: BREX system P-loop protein BrxC, partial [Caldilineaceae bacterium]|nr:BREX system P-loop protein BrxC [Caldilineaceae bacterium]